jgi:hypothetical protein
MWNVIKGLEKEKYDYLLRSVYSPENSDDFHNQFTPYELCAEIVGKVGIEINEQKRWLIIANLEFVIVLKRYFKYRKWDFSTVSFATPCNTKAEVAKILGIKNIVKYSYKKLKEWEMDEKKKEFDVIIGNPPYKRGLHLTILEKCVELLSNNGQLLFVHPGEWLSQLRTNGKGSYYQQLREQLSPITKSIEFRNGNQEMNIGLYVPLSITHLDKNKLSNNKKILFKNNGINYNVSHLNEINPWYNAIVLKQILNKCVSSISLKNVLKQFKGNYYVSFNGITGGGFLNIEYYDGIKRNTSNMFNLIGNTCNFVSNKPVISRPSKKGKEGNQKLWVSFKSEQEAYNFLGYLTKTKFIKFLIVILKIDQHADSILNYIPMFDFNQEWNDEKLNDYFNFSKEEIEIINEIVDKVTIN